MICNTENCTTPATHTDWKDELICSECVASAVEFGEKAGTFKLIDPDTDQPVSAADVPIQAESEGFVIESEKEIPDITATQGAEIIKDLGLDHIAEPVTYNNHSQEKNEHMPPARIPADDFSVDFSETVTAEPETPISDAALEILEGDTGNTQEAMDEYLKLSTPPDSAALTIFEESLTETGLLKIKEKSELMPSIAKNSEDYALVYEFSTALKRASVAARKKIKELKGDLKKQYDTARGKIEKDLDYVLKIIDPIISDLADSRDYMESWTEALKENKALKLAAEQEKERERVRLEKHRLINEENERQRVEAARIETARVKLERDRYEFECEKSRLSPEDAFNHWLEIIKEKERQDAAIPEIELNLDVISEHGTIGAGQGALKSDYPELTATIIGPTYEGKELSEKETQTIIDQIGEPLKAAGYEPAEPVETETFADEFTSTELPDGTIIVGGNENSEVSVSLYSTDPSEKELQLLELAHPVISEIKRSVKTVIDFIDAVSTQGFESKTATTATRALIADIGAAAAKFSEVVEPPTVTGGDCPF